MKAVDDSIRAGTDSIFSYIRRTAERDGARCRWRTVDYENRFQYGITLFNGVGGIPLFLGDYARQRGNEEAMDFAWSAIEWCADPIHQGPTRGLFFGKAGPAFAALLLDDRPFSPAISRLCEEATAAILRESPGPVTDMVGGAASNGYYLLQALKRSGDPALLAGAVRCGEWLREQLVRDELGCHCLVRPDGRHFGRRAYTGFAHGISGVAFYFALLFEATRDIVWKETSLEIFDTLIAHAQPIYGGWNWSPILGETQLSRCQSGHGAPGVGLAFLMAGEIFGDARLRHAATMAGEATYRYGDFRKNPTQSTGLAGNGDFLLELARVTGEIVWLERAREFGQMVLGYRAKLPEGDAWPTDEPGLYSPDFVYGAAGTGHFLLRLETGKLPMPLIGPALERRK